jgi:hypothetical protein
LAFIVVLFLDLLQYLITAAVWGPWARRKEKEAQGWRKGCARDWNKEVVVDDREIGGAKDWFNVPTWWVFALKMAILLVGAGFLLAAFAERLTVS